VKRILALMVPLLALLASGCGEPQQLSVTDAVVKLSPVDSNPSVLYFTVNGGQTDVDLVRVGSPSVIRTEMHDSMSDPKTGMMTMAPLTRVKIPANGTVEFKRGGKHAMLFGVNKVARGLERLNAEFAFSNGQRLIVEAPVEKITDSDHQGH
jgi:periplasmic copper chaperone A